MNTQIGIFDSSEPLKITKPIRLIELFAGYGSQSLSLKYLGVPFEHWKISEWAIPSIKAYKDVHFPEDVTDYSEGMTNQELVDFFTKHQISADYNSPLSTEQLRKRKDLRLIYNSAKASHNLLSVTSANGEDLEITDTDKFTYIMTYSFPCQDLSGAGLQAGMKRGSGTRSGMLWEVERLLKEIVTSGAELPQVLLMENVPDICSTKNINDFNEWLQFLEKIGYQSKYSILNAKKYSIPQNRERCFCVSWLGDYYYNFPEETGLEYNLSYFIDDEVDEKYFLSEKMVEKYLAFNAQSEAKGREFKFEPINWDGTSKTILTRPGQRPCDNYLSVSSPLNCDKDGVSRTIKAQYQNSSRANFQRQDGLGATGVIRTTIDKSSRNLNVEREREAGRADKRHERSELYSNGILRERKQGTPMEKEISNNRGYCAYGFRHGVSERFQRKPLFELSRAITTQGDGGVICKRKK